MPHLEPGEILGEFRGVNLGDKRLDRRLVAIAERFASSSDASIPSIATTQSDAEAMYRFFSNEKVTLKGVLGPHFIQTIQRCRDAKVVRVAHDTTPLVYRGDRDGNGPIRGKGQGFYLHLAVAVGGGDDRRALGVLGATTYAHPKDSARKKMTLAQRQKLLKKLPRVEKISSRWEQLARAVQDALPPEVEAIHVMDQEADDFLLMSELTEAGLRFVVRGSGSRATAAVQKTVAATMRSAHGVLFRTVAVNARRVSSRKSRPTRSERMAELSVRWAQIDISKPSTLKEEGVVRELPVTVVHVYEAKPPNGETPIEWFLFTNEEVRTLADVERVVDHYRARWVVEEFFKALKTGCAVEKRQLTTFDALNRILGVLLPIAWRLLLLRNLGAKTDSPPASEVMTESQVELLRVLLKARRPKNVLPEHPSVRDVMLAIAALGGHLPNNGEPGWMVLGRGFQIHTDAEVLWDAMRCDQS